MIYRALVLLTFLTWILVLWNYLSGKRLSFRSVTMPAAEPTSGRRLVFRVSFRFALICFVVMILSGFIPVIYGADFLEGVFLVVHVTIAPFYMVILLIMLISGAGRFRGSINRGPAENPVWQRWSFWLFIVLSVTAAVPIILMLFPLFDTAGQLVLLGIHRYAALLLLIVFIHFIFRLTTR